MIGESIKVQPFRQIEIYRYISELSGCIIFSLAELISYKSYTAVFNGSTAPQYKVIFVGTIRLHNTFGTLKTPPILTFIKYYSYTKVILDYQKSITYSQSYTTSDTKIELYQTPVGQHLCPLSKEW